MDQSVDQVGDAVDSGQAAGSQGDAAERWLRAGGEDDERAEAEAVEAGSRRQSDGSSPPSPSDGLTSRPVADVLDILGLSASTPPTAISVDGRRVVNGLFNDHVTNNNNYNSNNNVAS